MPWPQALPQETPTLRLSGAGIHSAPGTPSPGLENSLKLSPRDLVTSLGGPLALTSSSKGPWPPELRPTDEPRVRRQAALRQRRGN